MKPRIFIGSSKEGKRYADGIHANLRREAECTVWTDGVFGLSESTLQSLMGEVHKSEFAVFVFSGDDVAEIRGELFSVPRDNVVYELGLFSGVLGPERCFFVTPDDAQIHLPSDLWGTTPGEYEANRQDKNTQAAVAVFCAKVSEKIRALTLQVQFVDPKPKAQLKVGWNTFALQCTARPGQDVFLFTQKGDQWWPRRERLRRTTDNRYEVKTWFDGPGHQTIHVVRTTDLGMLLIENYFYFVDQLKNYPPITGGDLPREFKSLADITVEIVPKPD